MLNKLKYRIKLLPPLLLMVLLICFADEAKAACIEALQLCGRLIVPSLFPFFVLSAFLTRLGLPGILGKLIAPFFCRIYGISPAGASALVLGFIGGYPAGANYIADLETNSVIDGSEAERLIAFCNNSGPAFIIGVMGNAIFSSVQTGLRLYAIHVASALLTGLFFRQEHYSRHAQPHMLDTVKTGDALVDSVKQSVSTIINVCGFVVSFSVLVSMADSCGLFHVLCRYASLLSGLDIDFIKAAIVGFMELGSGAAAMTGFAPSPLNLALAAGMLSWGGLSVHFQTVAVLSESKIKGTLHLTGRLISSCIAFVLMFVLSIF